MNILIFGANWYNRGDESAIRAMIDEIRIIMPDCKIKIHFNQSVEMIPYEDIVILQPFIKLHRRNIIKTILDYLAIRTNGKIPYIAKDTSPFYDFIESVEWADYAIYAPGGPCIGDYYSIRKILLQIIGLIVRHKVPYSMYAPSVGPFTKDRYMIKKYLRRAEVLCFREELSQKYFTEIIPERKTFVTLDSAFQHRIDMQDNAEKLDSYKELKHFLETNVRVIGVTITDLTWHVKYQDGEMKRVIDATFNKFLPYLEDQDFGILFIPQQFGRDNDKNYLSEFTRRNSFVMSDKYDCYFQQYIISKLYAVVGMRYHSNIFSAKMGTPFVSIAYEQKMEGFMKKAELQKYCITVDSLCFESLRDVFEKVVNHYDEIKEILSLKESWIRTESYKTTELIVENMEKFVKNN